MTGVEEIIKKIHKMREELQELEKKLEDFSKQANGEKEKEKKPPG